MIRCLLCLEPLSKEVDDCPLSHEYLGSRETRRHDKEGSTTVNNFVAWNTMSFLTVRGLTREYFNSFYRNSELICWNKDASFV